MTDAANSNRGETDSEVRPLRVRHVVDEFIARRARGKPVSRDELLQQHADLREDIAAELSQLELIDRTRETISSALANTPRTSAYRIRQKMMAATKCRFLPNALKIQTSLASSWSR